MLSILHLIDKYKMFKVLTVFVGVLSYTTLLQTSGRFSLWSIFYGEQNDRNFETQLYVPLATSGGKGRHQNTQQSITKADKSLLVSLQNLAFF